MSNLETLRSDWRTTIENEGGHCPVCDRWGKIYKRPINRSMAASLAWLCNATPDEDGWVNVAGTAPKWLIRTNQLSTLKWWGLVERLDSDDAKKKHSGMWKVTATGRAFVMQGTRIPKYVFTYNDDVEGFGAETVTLRGCFKDSFDYEEVMNGRFSDDH